MAGPAKQPRFFTDFSLGRFLFKASGLFIGLLGAGSAFSDYSSFVSELRDSMKAERWTIFYIYGAWMAAFAIYELVRLKARYDLAVLRYERQRRPRRKR